MLKEFKEFIQRGNVMDMAVGIILGAAFTAIVTSFVDNMVTPLIGMFLGGVDFGALSFSVGEAVFGYGAFIMAIINFLVIAFVVFMLVRSMNNKRRKEEEAPAEPAGPTTEELLVQIRDSLQK